MKNDDSEASMMNSMKKISYISLFMLLTIVGFAQDPSPLEQPTENNKQEALKIGMDVDLKQLHDKFLSEGFRRFYIEGIGGGQSDDVEVLGFENGNWEVYYMERRQKSTPIFSSTNKKEAIEYYTQHVCGIKHHHLAVMTRSEQKISAYKELLIQHKVEFMQNDIPHYNATNDVVYRLFVFNKDRFKLKEMDASLPFRDEGL